MPCQLQIKRLSTTSSVAKLCGQTRRRHEFCSEPEISDLRSGNPPSLYAEMKKRIVLNLASPSCIASHSGNYVILAPAFSFTHGVAAAAAMLLLLRWAGIVVPPVPEKNMTASSHIFTANFALRSGSFFAPRVHVRHSSIKRGHFLCCVLATLYWELFVYQNPTLSRFSKYVLPLFV